MQPNDVMMTAFLGLALVLAGFMEALGKPVIRRIVKRIGKHTRWSPDDGDKKLTFQVVAAMIGILAAWGIDGMSFAEMWGIIVPDDWWLVMGDILTSGLLLSLGNKSIHWLIDLIRDNGDLLRVLLQNKAKNGPKIEGELLDTLQLTK